MQREQYDRATTALLSLAKQVADRKRPAYTVGSSDVLANFKRIGDRTGLTPLAVLDVYFLKHIDSITAYSDENIDQSEPIAQRFADAINYLLLKFALLVEQMGDVEADTFIDLMMENVENDNRT